ncbi:hypothetical protein BXP70_22510 [Hymenobacter crusticola]|uniref:Secretion system C-terminal sorting domain-containing protein n=1 Tax=Hymenobacter crusticola TaxID=1770526 RepID=A0A243WA32_9BACT|nr:hypothetical protein BXP70_22510 [Hymenobacter crusticola]
MAVSSIGGAYAQAPTVTGLTPARNARSAPRTTNVAATFNQPLSNTPVTQQAIWVFGQQAGKKAGTATVSGNTLTFDPSSDFKAGETVYATITGAAQSSGGVGAIPHVFQFTTATALAPATFAPAQLAPLGFYPNEVKFGDLNGDGALDILAASNNSNVAIRLNNGSGVFGNTQTVAVGAEPRVLATADIDGDGDLDFLTSNNTSGTTPVSVNLNNGNGTFLSGQSVQPGGAVLSLTLGDVDGDGDADLLIGKYSTVAVRLNNGSGLFSGNQEVPVDAMFIEAVALGDVDSDGDLDLLTANDSRGTVSVRLNNGSGTFAGGSEVAVGGQLFDVTTGDVDADGDLDLVAASQSMGKVSVRLNSGNGTFTTGQDLVVGPSPYTVELGDLDGDGDLDLVTGRTSGGTSVSLNNGSGTYAPAKTLTPVSYSRPLALGDADNDGDLDILTGNDSSTSYGLNLFLNQPAPSITSVTPNTTSAGVSVTIIGNNLLGANGVTFNGVEATSFVANSNTQLTVTVPNGVSSGPLVVTSVLGNSNSVPFTISSALGVVSVTPARNSNTAPLRGPVTVTLRVPFSNSPATLGALKVFSQQSGGLKAGTASVNSTALSFTPASPFRAGETVYATLTGQAQSGPGAEITPHVFQFTTATSPSSGTFSPGTTLSLYTPITTVLTGDVDGDGDQDLLVLPSVSGSALRQVRIYLNNGNSSFTSASSFTLRSTPTNLELGDIDGDGDLDLLAPNNGPVLTGTLDTYLNNGQGAFTLVPGSAANPIALGTYKLRDADGDGDLDIFALNYATARVYFNNGSGTFGSMREVPVGENPVFLAVGDVDNDGDLDLLTAPYSPQMTVSVRLNDGTGTFSGNQEVYISEIFLPSGLDLGDVDGDGDLDFVTISNSTKNASIRLNNGAGQFSGNQEVAVGSGGNPRSVSLNDIDGDGDLDLLTTSTSNTVSVRRNNGAGIFTGNQEVPSTNTPGILYARDMDNDGDLDLVTLGYDVVQVQLNGNTTLLPTAFSPARNARSAPRDTDVAVTFNQALTNNAATQGALKVFGQQSGLKASAVTVSGNTLTLNPNADFKPGEKVFATLTTAAQSSTGSLPNAQVYQFTAAAASGPGTFLGGSDADGGGRLAVGDVDGDGDLDYVTYGGAVRLNNGSGTYTNGQQLSIGGPRNVALGDLDSDGDLDLVLSVNTGRGFVYVRLNNGAGTFSGTQQLSVGAEPYGLALGDVDADGDLDVLTANGTSGSVSVRLNDGLGTFASTGQELSTGGQSTSLALGDLDSDGDLDIIVGNVNTNTVLVRFNNGQGSFSGNQTVTVGFNPNNLALGDVDGDGDLDFVSSNLNNYVNGQRTNGTVSVGLNDGFGTFRESQQVALSGSPLDVTLGDLDGDGDLDLVSANGGSNFGSTASVRLNNGSGTFAGSQEVTVSSAPASVVLADADGDGDLDLYTGGSNSTSVRLNQSAASLLAVTAVSPKRNAPTAPRTTPVAVTLNQTLSNSPTNLDALRVFSAQAGGLKTGTSTVSGNTVSFATTASFKPGETVFATVLPVLRSTGNQTLVTPQVFQFTAATAPSTVTFSGSDLGVGTSPQATTTGDIDNDGDLDLLTVNTTPVGTVSVRLNNGNGTFTTGQQVPVGFNPYHLVLGDLDGDGDLDLVVANAGGSDGIISLAYNNGTGTFYLFSQAYAGNNPHAVALGDVDGDGDLDLLAANYTISGNTTSSSVSVRLNSGGIGFGGQQQEVSVGTRPLSLALGDADNDGDLDLFTANSNTSTVSLRLNTGTGIFSGTTEIGVAYNPEVLTLGDIDNDGDLDLLTSNAASNAVSIRLNNGLGSFSGTEQLTGLSTPRSLALGDADGDGDLDVLVTNGGNNTVSVRLNNGTGSFSGNLQVPVGTAPTGLALADLDGNGTLDFVTSNLGAGTASIRLNAASSASAAKVLAKAPAKLTEQVELYPNPAHASVHLQLPTELAQQAVQLSLVNALGQVVLEQQLSARQTAAELKLGSLAQGVYSMQLRTAAGLVTKRLVVE